MQATELPDSTPPKPLDQVRQVIRRKHYSIRTEDAYVNWIRRLLAELKDTWRLLRCARNDRL